MAAYKVIQDIEAEDKILGPLTLRQFIYAGISAFFLYLTYYVFSKGATFLVAFFLPVALVVGFFAFPWGRDQPTEVWALAKIRFMLKPRRRIWDQSAVKELVTVTAPKKEGPSYATKNLSQVEVKSRLFALADTLDSRGWAVKNASVNLYGQPSLLAGEPDSDRLVGMSTLPQQPLQAVDVRAADDILDEQNNPVAQHVNSMIEASARAHRQKIVDSLNQPSGQAAPAANGSANNYWFLNQPAQPTSVPDDMVTFNTQVVTPGMSESDLTVGVPAVPSPTEENLVRELQSKQQGTMTSYYGHLHTIQPLSQAHPQPAVSQPTPMPMPAQPVYAQPAAAVPTIAQPQPPQMAAPQVTPAQQTAILQLANNDDLNVATIAREAQRSGPQDEVVIKLH